MDFSNKMKYSAQINFVSAGIQIQKKDMDAESAPNDGKAIRDQKNKLADTFGDWEKHTKGIGAKLLLGIGFEPGKGLGKNLQGRTGIVEAHLRKGRRAVGADSHERQMTQTSKMNGQTLKSKVEKKRNICEQVSLQQVKKKVNTERRHRECRQCGKTFDSLAGWRDHENSHSHSHQDSHGKLLKRSSKFGQYSRHQRVLASDQLPANKEDCQAQKRSKAKYQCKVCGLTFSSDWLRNSHQDSHAKLLKCRICNESFGTVKEKVKHEMEGHKWKKK